MEKVLTKDVLLACKIASKSLIKPELAGIKITPSRIIATDGFKAIIINRKEEIGEFPEDIKIEANLSEEGVLINAEQLATLKFSKSKFLDINEKAIIVEKENKVDIITTDLDTTNTVSFKKVEGHYPEINDILPKDESESFAKFNADLLLELLSCYKGEEVILELRGKEKAIVIKTDNKTGLLMPINIA